MSQRVTRSMVRDLKAVKVEVKIEPPLETQTTDKSKPTKPQKVKQETSSKAYCSSPKKKAKVTKPKVEKPDQVLKKETTGKVASKASKVTAKKEKVSNKKFVGAHVSIAGGLHNAVSSALEMGAKSFAMFLRSQRQWNSKPLEDKAAEKFREACQKHGFGPHLIIPHGSYLMNCGSPNEEILQKSRDALVEDMTRCEKMGLTMFNFHPGSTCGEIAIEDCIAKISESINLAHKKTKHVITVIENMSCQGHTIGGKFTELKAIIDGIKDKSRVGVCLDTCHAFAAGYNIKAQEGYEKMMSEFDDIIGLRYLRAVHLNDSKGDVGCHLDRHENIGRGKIGKAGFEFLMNDPRFDNLPLVLETPECDYGKEIQKLYSMCHD